MTTSTPSTPSKRLKLVPASQQSALGSSIKSDMDAMVGAEVRPGSCRQDFADDSPKRSTARWSSAFEKGTKPEHVKVGLRRAPGHSKPMRTSPSLRTIRSTAGRARAERFRYRRTATVRAGIQSGFRSSARTLRRLQPRSRPGALVIACGFVSISRASTSNGMRRHCARLTERPDVPGIYRERYHMAPDLSVVL